MFIVKGFGEFQINDSIYKVTAGDWIVIPKNTWYGVIVN
jgi:mannose-6-phosphate isomerase-like protein (cupin superfamily)